MLANIISPMCAFKDFKVIVVLGRRVADTPKLYAKVTAVLVRHVLPQVGCLATIADHTLIDGHLLVWHI